MKIGAKIKELRTRNGLTLEELASRSELTKGFLSQLERDLTSPSISTLEDILEALGTNLSEFFQSTPEQQITFGKNDFFVDERDEHTVEWIVPNAQKNEMEPIRITIHPGCTSFIMKANEGQEFGYVLNGQVELVIGKKVYSMKAKETFYLNGARSHFIRNKGKKDAVLLWIATPPMF
ncbi:XRE family transcriptional regulator [Faecalicoccus pleomorphus]|uniref:Repressor protein n=1 Tax=Faecalicoccus pleomorphus TaxID=1323 RepID=A0A380LQA3_9FIRM|nr:XRE family transcriptional regulator [Faecalicoccus pleomorphus]MBM6807475.1 helix-turn-helix transcriptional regulator [Faecalicoccus pleomorphus]MDB7986949.1 XRE family transcriptional regulator [Faecalicoccus pleomorphus]MDB7991541.1 XRE family transcriptional regulator [Faecalicoccus pleomorphus]SUO04760.1 repressor protein [Faecalicoccus pleomorphus]